MQITAIFSKKFFLWTSIFALAYFLVNIYVLNFRLVVQTLLGNYPSVYKTNLFIALLEGAFSAFSVYSLVTLSLISILTGVNLYLIIKRVRYIHNLRKINKQLEAEKRRDNIWEILVGLGSMMGIISSGCASCSLPILALAGFSGSLVYLPFRGEELPIVSLILLVATLVLMLRSTITLKACQVS